VLQNSIKYLAGKKFVFLRQSVEIQYPTLSEAYLMVVSICHLKMNTVRRTFQCGEPISQVLDTTCVETWEFWFLSFCDKTS